MPFLEFFNPEAALAEAHAYWSYCCNQYYLLDEEPYETGPDWIYVAIQGEPPVHDWFEGEKMDAGFNYLPCLNLKTGETIHVLMGEWPQSYKQKCTQYHGRSRFQEIELIDNAMEVLAWVSL